MKRKSALSLFEERVKKDPYGNFLGIKLEEVKEGYARVSITLTENFCNFLGYIHGGLIFSLADQAFAAASNSKEKLSLALQMSISYVKAPLVGDTLIAEAREEYLTSKIGLYQINVKTSSNQLIAQAQGIVYRKNGHNKNQN